MIREITDFSEVLHIVPMEIAARSQYPAKHSVPLKDYIVLLECIMNGKPFVHKKELKIFYSYSEEGEVNGYMIAVLTITKIRSLNDTRIIKAWYDHEHPDAIRELYDTVVKWSKENGVSVLRAELDWNEKLISSLESKWAFEKSTAVMQRRI